MARLPILEYPDPRLRLRAEQVTTFDHALGKLTDDLVETLHVSGGIGLSAPQAGIQLQVLVIDLSGGASAPHVYVNPQILTRSAPGLVEESCLSVPGIVGNVVRATQLRVLARDVAGAVFESDLEGMHAVCLQHEMDHLVGKLFVDRLSLLRRLRTRVAGTLSTRRRIAATGSTKTVG
jgi:peptide deformylase